MGSERNKAIVIDWMNANVTGDLEKAKSFYADDCRFLVAGDMPYCGWMDIDGFLGQMTILPLDGPLIFEVGDMTAEGDKVWFEAQSFGKLKDGQKYDNAYVFFVRLRDGKIVEYKEFIDTYYVNRLIDSPHTRGAPKPRYRIFETPTVTLSGDALGETLRGEGVEYEGSGA
jgi:ketosteroid isomerase-like protein